MSVSGIVVAKIREGCAIREEVTCTGDMSGGVATLQVTVPRGYRLTKAYVYARATIAVDFGTPYLRLTYGGNTWDVGFPYYLRDTDEQYSQWINPDLPVNAIPRAVDNTAGIYCLWTNGNTYTYVMTVIAEVEPVDVTLRESQFGKFSMKNFFAKLESAIFRTPFKGQRA